MSKKAKEPVKTQDDYRLAYAAAAQRAGDLQYRILCFQNELGACNEEMKKINIASKELLRADEARAKAAAARKGSAEYSSSDKGVGKQEEANV